MGRFILTVTIQAGPITRGECSLKRFNIAYFVLVFPYSTFRVRSYKFETLSYAIKLKDFSLTSG